MKQYEFHNGQKLKALCFSDDENINASDTLTIAVLMESGQMAGVPWAVVEDAGRVWKWNLALVLGVELEEDSPNDT